VAVRQRTAKRLDDVRRDLATRITLEPPD